jgi:hypothetical protein
MKSSIDSVSEVTMLKRRDQRSNDIFRNRIRNPLLCQPELNSTARAYLRDLRAAEMLAWQLTGGDYLISGRELEIFSRESVNVNNA